MERLASEARALRILRSAGAVESCCIVAWADRVIDEDEHPAPQLLDLSLHIDRAYFSPDRALSELSEKASPQLSWKLFCGVLLYNLLAEPAADSSVARVLYGEAVDEDSWFGEAAYEMSSFWDAIDLARDGVYGDLAEERKRLEMFLREHGEEELDWASKLFEAQQTC